LGIGIVNKLALCAAIMILAAVPLAFAQEGSKIPTDKGTLDVALTIKPFPPELRKPVMISFEFVEPNTDNLKNHIDYRVTVVQGGQDMHTTYKQHTHSGADSFSYAFMVQGQYDIRVSLEGIDFNPIPKEIAIFPIMIGKEEKISIDLGQITTEDEPVKIPDWIRNNAGWWSNGQISDSDFLTGIQYLIDQGIMIIPKTETTQEVAIPSLPSWIKQTAGWWARDQVTDDDFVNGIQYLVEHGIIRV